MARARTHLWTVEDFLAFEAQEPERYELVDGIVRLMTGGSAAHSAIKGNISADLRSASRCSRPPASATTKWREYQRIGSLRHFVMVEQKERRIEVYTRTPSGWALATVEPPDDEVLLDAIDARLSLTAVYAGSGR
jgi:Uma2 family endonuclease